MAKSVQFSETSFHWVPWEPRLQTDYMRPSIERKSLETSVLKHPRTQIETLKELIASWRQRDISIVLGNLGRQPYLLTYFLDLCFSYQETVKLVCAWDVASDYQASDATDADFVILLEPFFGFTVHKDPTVRHLIILTSHLSFSYWGPLEMTFYYLHLSNVTTTQPPDTTLQHGIEFTPPLFHQQVYGDPLPAEVMLDVSLAVTAHEAFLKLLTGRELIRGRRFNVKLNDRDRIILTLNLQNTAQTFFRVGQDFITGKDPIHAGTLAEDCFLYNFLNIH